MGLGSQIHTGKDLRYKPNQRRPDTHKTALNSKNLLHSDTNRTDINDEPPAKKSPLHAFTGITKMNRAG